MHYAFVARPKLKTSMLFARLLVCSFAHEAGVGG